jgi:hypothetical protein
MSTVEVPLRVEDMITVLAESESHDEYPKCIDRNFARDMVCQ